MNTETGILAAAAANLVTISPPGQVVRAVIWGKPVYFTVTNPRDSIQKHHVQGGFYEQEELEIIRKYCPPGAVFCDIGANIGNHTLFVLSFLHVARAILFEPNPLAIAILRSNLELNGLLDRCDLSNLGFGLSDVASGGLSITASRRNLGGGKMVEGSGDLEVRRGDAMLGDTAVDFIKIDVEGMEIKVLDGLAATIVAHRPTIFVEVDEANRPAFEAWVQANNYVARARYRRYRANQNFLLVAREAPRAG